jgi:U3-containing 90S pre-ribosomal complex subunit
LPYLVGVGTPARLIKILETDPDAMKLNRIEYLIVDGSWRDGKNMSILDLPETHLDLKKLADMVQEHALGIYSL